MKAVAKRRARIVRVREVQHLQASAVAAQAEAKLVSLEDSASRLVGLRASLLDHVGMSFGAALAAKSELADRLENARHGLTDAIASARAVAEAKAEARLDARRQQESAEKLRERAAAELARMAELRMMASLRPRPRRIAGEQA